MQKPVFRIENDNLIVQPYINDLNQSVISGAICLLFILLIVVFEPFRVNWMFPLVLASFSGLYGLVNLLFKVKIEMIFDKKNKIVIRKHPILGTRKIMDFNQIVFTIQRRGNRYCYTINFSDNIYGIGYPISPMFGSEKKLAQYKTEVLSIIENYIKE